ncbi:PAS domain S-box protein [Silvibacterium acidisoli]|uniref:PAS domain S-box protein n=1 Tax=Acidobacteriaceae bacterium ZG23-2 TaxID=2883246 RepID=UPI00406C22A3
MSQGNNSIHPRPDEIWLRLIADSLPAYVAYVDENLCYRMVNRKYGEQFGLEVAKILNRPVKEVLGASYENVRHHLEGALSGRTQRFETRMKTLEGNRVLLVTHLPDRDDTGHVRGIIVHGVDVTERHQAEQALRRSEDRFRILLERASVGINIGNAQGELSYMNPALLDILGYSEEDVQAGRVRWDELTPEKFVEKDKLALVQLKDTGFAQPYEKEYRAKDGRLIPMLLGAAIIPNLTQEESEDIAVFFTDLTLQKTAERALVQSEKLAAVGKLAASIAHEINNPLEAVTNLLFLARQDPSLSQQAREYLETADRELTRMGQVTSQTLRFHRQSTRAQTLGIEQLVIEALKLYASRLNNARIPVKLKDGHDASLTCYESDIRQVLNNLIGNAIDAMRGGGNLIIRTRNSTNWRNGIAGVRVTIADSGTGMPPEVQTQAFEAFYTTKGINGTGLGLWICQRITHKHRGRLCVKSSVAPSRHGTVFTLWLPKELAPDASQGWVPDALI